LHNFLNFLNYISIEQTASAVFVVFDYFAVTEEKRRILYILAKSTVLNLQMFDKKIIVFSNSQPRVKIFLKLRKFQVRYFDIIQKLYSFQNLSLGLKYF